MICDSPLVSSSDELQEAQCFVYDIGAKKHLFFRVHCLHKVPTTVCIFVAHLDFIDIFAYNRCFMQRFVAVCIIN